MPGVDQGHAQVAEEPAGASAGQEQEQQDLLGLGLEPSGLRVHARRLLPPLQQGEGVAGVAVCSRVAGVELESVPVPHDGSIEVRGGGGVPVCGETVAGLGRGGTEGESEG
eukprot:589036-Hanusia_phi.AAC.3